MGKSTPLTNAGYDTSQRPSCVLLLTGEGAHAKLAHTAVSTLRASSLWAALKVATEQLLGRSLEDFLSCHLGDHAAPNSPLITTLVNLLTADRWCTAGHAPCFVLGHSIGEVAAAHLAHLLDAYQTLSTAYALGLLGSLHTGAMVSARLTCGQVDTWSDEELCIGAVNGLMSGSGGPSLLSVTLCGPSKCVETWLIAHSDAKRLPVLHPWHHPIYHALNSRGVLLLDALPKGVRSAAARAGPTFLTAGGAVHQIDAKHWHAWLSTTVDFMGALFRLAACLGDASCCYIIETGAHDALTLTAVKTLASCGVSVVGTAASMRRGQPDTFWEEQKLRLEAQLVGGRSHSSALSTRLNQVALQDSPRNVHAITARLRTMLATSFHMEAVGADAPLMESGLESDDVPGLIEQLSTTFHAQLPVTFLFDCGNIRAIAEHLAGTERLLACVRPCAHTRQRQPSALKSRSLTSSLAGISRAVELSALAAAGGDAIHQVPSSRWLLERSSPCAAFYGAFVVSTQHFDGAFFGISHAEAHAMDPQQRLLLETGYTSLHGSHERLISLCAGDIGTFLGIMNTDFVALQKQDSVYVATGSTISVAAGRLSFALGMQGPCITYDTACSSALAAIHGALSCVTAGECRQALTLAVNLMLTPKTHTVYAKAGMLSADGRCKTLDARANGYVRGEGVGAVTLGEDASGLALLSSLVRSDGKTASLTAPSGMAQRQLISSALCVAGVDALCSVEAHGTGTKLGDPTEVGALEKALNSGRPCIASVKAHLGHTEPMAGLAGLVAIIETQGSATNAQLRRINPLLQSSLRELRAHVPAQRVSIVNAQAGGVSSFGYSGTIGHTVLRLVCHAQGHVLSPSKLRWMRHNFSWDVRHPFASHRVPSSEGTVVFHSNSASLQSLVSNHVVQNTVVFPGAGFLEMARAVAPKSLALQSVFFTQALVIGAPALCIKCILSNSQFEVCSDEDDQVVKVTLHCSGKLVASDGCQRIDHASAHSCSCVHATHVAVLYDRFDAVELQYGPGYRTLLRTWAGKSDEIGRLKARATREGTQLHPADLDDAICLGVALAMRGRGVQTQLPFAVNDAKLNGSPGTLIAVSRNLSSSVSAPLHC